MLLTSDSLVKQALDPSQAEIPQESLWTVFGSMLGFTLVGLFILWLVLRKLGKPGGEVRRSDLVLAFPVSVGVVLVYVTAVGALWTSSPLMAGLVQSALALTCIFLVAFNPWRPSEQSAAEWIRVRLSHLAVTPLIWAFAVPVLICAMFAAVALAQLANLPITIQGPIEQLRSENSPIWIIGWYVSAGIAAPLLEEFVFRVVLFGGLMGLLKPLSKGEGWRHPGTWIALVVSGALFVLAHGVWEWQVGIIPLSALTFVLSALYLHTRSIWPSILLHATHNSFVVTMQFFVLM